MADHTRPNSVPSHRPACQCEAGYWQLHCLSCGAKAVSVRYRLPDWMIIAIIVAMIIVASMLGWWLGAP